MSSAQLIKGGRVARAYKTMTASRGNCGHGVRIATGEVILEIDVAGILGLLGPRALFNKNGHAVGLGGLVTARARGVTIETKEREARP